MEGIKYKIRERWYLRWILLFSNWFFQGIINADTTEKYYKILFSLFLTLILYSCMGFHYNPTCIFSACHFIYNRAYIKLVNKW